MSRIIAGQFGGRRLQTPDGETTRPTTDRTRESLFSSLEAAADLTGGPFLDVYAGSGAVGLEALSRGAPAAYFVDNSRAALAAIGSNISSLGLAHRCTVVAADAGTSARRLRDIAAMTVFADPPYDTDGAEVAAVLSDLLATGAIDPEATVVVERGRRSDWGWPAGFVGLRERRYGEAKLWYGRPL